MQRCGHAKPQPVLLLGSREVENPVPRAECVFENTIQYVKMNIDEMLFGVTARVNGRWRSTSGKFHRASRKFMSLKSFIQFAVGSGRNSGRRGSEARTAGDTEANSGVRIADWVYGNYADGSNRGGQEVRTI